VIRRWLRRLAWLAAALAWLALLAIGSGALWLRYALRPAADAPAQPVPFVVAEGSTLRRVARELEQAGIVRSARAFEGLARWQGAEDALRAGQYELHASDAPAAILDAIRSGRVKTWELAIPEGLTAVEIAGRVEAAGLAGRDAFLAVVNDPASPARYRVEGPSLEGYLFPETYQLAKGLAPEEVVGALLEQFHEVWAECEAPLRARGFSMRQAVTLASLVEKETGAPQERPLIAGVFLNRLKLGMRLETDPSVIYGIAGFDGNLTRAHLEDESNPYNTYRIPALPPGPIANPGADALRAVARPAETDSLYFVSRNDGTHAFAKSYAEHVGNVRRYQVRGEVGDGQRSP
jgi:UPF0755 protein